jgi:hypothetical protein
MNYHQYSRSLQELRTAVHEMNAIGNAFTLTRSGFGDAALSAAELRHHLSTHNNALGTVIDVLYRLLDDAERRERHERQLLSAPR